MNSFMVSTITALARWRRQGARTRQVAANLSAEVRAKCHNEYVLREPNDIRNDIRDDDKVVRAAYFRMICQHRAERKSAVLTHFDEPKLP
jgi:hypothetical protein